MSIRWWWPTRKRFFDIHISLGHYLSWSYMYILSKLTFVVFVEGNQGRDTFFAADIYLQLIYIWKIMELTLPFWRICYMHVITGGENTSSTVKLKLRGKLCNPFTIWIVILRITQYFCLPRYFRWSCSLPLTLKNDSTCMCC